MNLKLKLEYIDVNIHQPATGKIINVKFDIVPTDYEYYYNNGYEHLFEVVPEIEINPDEEIKSALRKNRSN